MERRDLIRSATVALVAAGFADVSPFSSTNLVTVFGAEKAQSKTGVLGLTGVEQNPELVAKIYKAKPGEGRDLQGSTLPYVYAFYDESAKKFVSPLDIVTSSPAGAYTLTSTLHSFNIKGDVQKQFAKLQNQVQLGFNATAPVTNSDSLTWVFMNAINIFLAKPADQATQLTKFTSGANDGTTLQANPKVSIPKGTVNLQVTAFGQKKDGPWKKFFDIIAGVVKSPIISDVSKGFGIPGLATEALQFVDHVIDVYTQQEKLVTLWQTGSLEFAVHKGANARFKLNPGLWTTIDSDYAQSSNFLEGHTVDLKFNSFRILDKNAKAVDASYLVTDLKLEAA
jgi:hypothetical protein